MANAGGKLLIDDPTAFVAEPRRAPHPRTCRSSRGPGVLPYSSGTTGLMKA